MNASPIFEWLKAKDIADHIVLNSTGKYLSDIEVDVLKGAWDGKTYDEMAHLYGYSSQYLNKDVGNKLWQKLSSGLGESVKKQNFREALRRAWEQQALNSQLIKSSEVFPHSVLHFPEGWEPLDSSFYVERSDIENSCYKAILTPGALIRIKAPKLMGKTSLLQRILDYSRQKNYRVLYLELGSCDRTILTDLDKFLRWLCLIASRQLKLDNRLQEYWDTDILGSNDNCTTYFEEYLLPESHTPVVLALDDSDRLFPYTHIVEDILGLLRSWHEKGKVSPIWKQLRLIIAHSTEIYIPLDINQSPFNAGFPIELQEFEFHHVETLIHCHGLNFNSNHIKTLMHWVGGHPYLIRLALYHLCKDLTLEKFVNQASTEAGIYSDHLRRHLDILHQSSSLISALQEVVSANIPVELDSMQTYKLHSMGLVQRIDNHVIPRCHLYREYFKRVLH